MKIVINRCYGGFGLSEEAVKRYFEIKDQPVWPEKGKFGVITYWLVAPEERMVAKEGADFYRMSDEDRREHNRLYSEQTWYSFDVERDDPVLVQVVEELGEKASDDCAELKVVEVPDDVHWEIQEYDGMEKVAETHRSWS